MALRYSTEENITSLATELAKVHRRKDLIRDELKMLDQKEKDLAFRINSTMGLVPIEEAAVKVKLMMDRMDRLGRLHKSEGMKRIWANKTEEERTAWKTRIQEARKLKSTKKGGDINGKE